MRYARFLSTPSARRATRTPQRGSAYTQFLSTPSARRATKTPRLWYTRGDISIHALREEGDEMLPEEEDDHAISIHALREEGD